MPQIKQVFEELGFVIAHNRHEDKVFFTVELDTFHPPYWLDLITEINLDGLLSVDEVKKYLEEENIKIARANVERGLNSEGIEVTNVAVYYFDRDNPEDLNFAIKKIRGKFPYLFPEKKRNSITIPLRYVRQTRKRKTGSQTEKDQTLNQGEIVVVSVPTVGNHPEKEDFFQELINLLEKHDKLPKQKEVDVTDMYRIPKSLKEVTIPISALKFDGAKSEVRIRAQALRDFLNREFPVEE